MRHIPNEPEEAESTPQPEQSDQTEHVERTEHVEETRDVEQETPPDDTNEEESSA